MPETIGSFLSQLSTPIKAALLAVLVALLRVFYDDHEPRYLRRFLEAMLCGALAFAIAEGLEALSMPAGAATFCGGFVGQLGADKARELGRLYVRQRIDQRTGQPPRHEDTQ